MNVFLQYEEWKKTMWRLESRISTAKCASTLYASSCLQCCTLYRTASSHATREKAMTRKMRMPSSTEYLCTCVHSHWQCPEGLSFSYHFLSSVMRSCSPCQKTTTYSGSMDHSFMACGTWCPFFQISVSLCWCLLPTSSWSPRASPVPKSLFLCSLSTIGLIFIFEMWFWLPGFACWGRDTAYLLCLRPILYPFLWQHMSFCILTGKRHNTGLDNSLHSQSLRKPECLCVLRCFLQGFLECKWMCVHHSLPSARRHTRGTYEFDYCTGCVLIPLKMIACLPFLFVLESFRIFITLLNILLTFNILLFVFLTNPRLVRKPFSKVLFVRHLMLTRKRWWHCRKRDKKKMKHTHKLQKYWSAFLKSYILFSRHFDGLLTY